jgi:NADH-quinone oxidoreductase subunit J
MIDSILLLFFAFAALAGAALMLVLAHPMRVALALVATMLSLAGIYALLGAHAVAIFQVLIYVGAVMVFMVYVIMLLEPAEPSLSRRFSWLLAPAALAFAGLLTLLGRGMWEGLRDSGAGPGFGVQPFSVAFLREYWLHFELVSVLLVAAIVAALAVVAIGRMRRG